MLRRLSAHLTYSNVMATIAVMIALGGTSYAATSLKKNSVTSRTIKNGQVKTADLANGAVTNAKLADSSVNSAKIAADSVTGANIDENSLQFKCEPGHYALAGRGLCAFEVDNSSGVNWTEAANTCSGNGRTPARLPTAGEAIAIAQGGNSPFRNTLLWTADPAPNNGDIGHAFAWEISINSDGSLNNFFEDNAKAPALAEPTQIGCVYNWTDILGPRP